MAPQTFLQVPIAESAAAAGDSHGAKAAAAASASAAANACVIYGGASLVPWDAIVARLKCDMSVGPVASVRACTCMTAGGGSPSIEWLDCWFGICCLPGSTFLVDRCAICNVCCRSSPTHPCSQLTPGTRAGLTTLAAFVSQRLKQYHALRNQPQHNHLSQLSPYFHFGQVAPQRAALTALKFKSVCGQRL